MKRRKHRWSLAIMAALVAFAQFAMAGERCMIIHEPAPAEQQMSGDEQCDAMPMDQASCLAQCLGGDESVATPNPLSLAAIAPAPAWMDFTLPGTRFVSAAYEAPSPCGPPLQILYCSYQT